MSISRPHLLGKGSASERRYKGATRSKRVERMATFVIQIWADHPALGYADVIDEVRKHFRCGQTAAEQAHKRAAERIEETATDPVMSARIAQGYWDLFAEAKRSKKLNAGRLLLDSLRAHLGVGAPERLEISTGTEVADLSEADLDEVIRRLEGRGGTAAAVPEAEPDPSTEH